MRVEYVWCYFHRASYKNVENSVNILGIPRGVCLSVYLLLPLHFLLYVYLQHTLSISPRDEIKLCRIP